MRIETGAGGTGVRGAEGEEEDVMGKVVVGRGTGIMIRGIYAEGWLEVSFDEGSPCEELPDKVEGDSSEEAAA